LVGQPEGKRKIGRSRRTWEDNIRMDLREIGWEVVDWIHLAQDRGYWWVLVNTVMNIWIHKSRITYWAVERPLASQERLCSMELVNHEAVKEMGL
jgi:hypothetical protein